MEVRCLPTARCKHSMRTRYPVIGGVRFGARGHFAFAEAQIRELGGVGAIHVGRPFLPRSGR